MKWLSVELFWIADRLNAAGNSANAYAIHRMIQVFLEGKARLKHLVDSVEEGTISHLAQ